MKLKRISALVVAFALIVTTLALPAYASGTKTYGYDNLNNESGELVVGFLGGSITVADGDSNSQGLNRYATRVTNWFREKYPNKTVTQVNAGIGGTGSNLGKYRVMTDIGAYAPDVVFIEYAVNDANYSSLYSETVRSNMETIVRTLQSLPKVPVIVFLYSMHDNSYSNIKYTSIPDHQAVADYYGIETINFYEYMSALVAKGDFVWDKTVQGSLTNDNIHPNAAGHKQYGDYIISQLEARNILRKNNTGLARKFWFATKDTRDIKFADADNLVKTGTWEDGVSGQADNKYEAIQATAEGDSVSFTYTSAGNDTIGATVLSGSGTFVVDEGTENEVSGTISGNSNLPEPKEFATGLAEGVHTVKIVNTSGLKLGRIIANGGTEINSASTAANGDHIAGSMPKNLLMNCQVPYYLSGRNDANVELTAYADDYTSNNSYTTSKFYTKDTVTAGGNWGIHGLNFPTYGSVSNGKEVTQGVRYDNLTPTAGTYVFKARVRTLSGEPTIGVTTVKNYTGTFDNQYGKTGFKPTAEWQDYKATVSPKADSFTFAFGVMNGVAGDTVLLDAGDGVYIAPEVAYDVSLKSTGANNEIIAGGKNTFKAELLNQIEIPTTSIAQEFTWSVADANGDAVEGLIVTPGDKTSDATVNASIDVPYGTYYLKAVATATNWQKTLPIEVVEGPPDPYARDHVPGEMPQNRFVSKRDSLWYNSRTTASQKIVTFTGSNWINGVGYAGNTFTAIQDVTSIESYYGAAGLYVKTTTDSTNPAIEMDASEHKAGDHYVFMFAIRNVNPEVPAQWRVGTWNGTYSGTANDYIPAQEYPNGILDVPQSGEWVIVKTTIAERTNPADGTAPSIRCGFPVGTAAGAAIELNIKHVDVPETYFAKEVPYSITLEGVNGNAVTTGNSAIFKAQLLNQLGLTGYLGQDNVTFTVGDAKGIPVDGLTVAGDGAKATVSATDDVAEGKYYLKANYAIDEDTTWIKTIEIDVIKAIANTLDFVQPEKPENLTTTSGQSGGSAGARWSSANVPDDLKVGSVGVATKISMDKDRLTGKDSNWYDSGIFITDKAKRDESTEGARRFIPEEYTNYVFAVKARSPLGNVRAGFANNLNYGKYTIGDHDAEGVQIGTGWTDFKTTLSTIDCNNYKFNYLTFGIVTGEAADYIVVDPSTFYLAEEVAYEFNVTASADSVAQGDVIELDATLLNQIGTEGALSQEFTWVAITDDRTEYLDGFTFEIDEDDASKVKVIVDDSVAVGDYLIVAQNAHEGVSKHYTLTVAEPQFDVTELELEVADGRAVLGALSVNSTEDVKVVIAAFRGYTLIGSDSTLLTPDDGEAVLREALSIEELESGDKVRVFVWNTNLAPFTMKNKYKTPIVVE